LEKKPERRLMAESVDINRPLWVESVNLKSLLSDFPKADSDNQ
jgi:hypothetical protein